MAAFLKPTPIKLAFLLEWPLYLFVFLWRGSLNGFEQLLPVLCAALFYYLAACLLVAVLERSRFCPTTSRLLIWSLALAGLDQIVKLAVYQWLPQDRVVPLLPGILHLNQSHNPYNSWLMSILGHQFIGQAGLAILGLLSLVSGIMIYRYYAAFKRHSPWAGLTLILMCAGVLSALCDQTLWGFTVDFLDLPGHFVADGKDLYLSFELGALIAEVIDSPSSFSLDLRGSVRETKAFLRFAHDELGALFVKRH